MKARANDYDEYGPFGEAVRASGSMAGYNPFEWSTKYTDAETGLNYYGDRYYNPSTGRWISRDPLGEAGGINLYTYVSNSPTNILDVLGLDSFQFLNQTVNFDSKAMTCDDIQTAMRRDEKSMANLEGIMNGEGDYQSTGLGACLSGSHPQPRPVVADFRRFAPDAATSWACGRQPDRHAWE